MLDIQLLREDPEKIKKAIATKNARPGLVDDFLALDGEWRAAQLELDSLRAKQNEFSRERKMEEAKKNKEHIKIKEEEVAMLFEKRNRILHEIPNPPLDDVPVGESDDDNVVLREVGEKPILEQPLDYLTLAQERGLIDMNRGAKVSGSRFGYLLGDSVKLEFALVEYALKSLTDQNVLADIIKKNNLDLPNAPFTPVVPPVLVNPRAMSSMGYLEHGGDEEVYYLPNDELYLVGTAEQSIGPMHMNEVFEEKDLPRRYLGFSTCFRREAGSYGKDTKGILRVHQFDKLEMFSITTPERSRDEHAFFLAIEEFLMQSLELPYRVVHICTADLGDPAAAKFDIEAWLPGQNGGRGEYRETHSASTTTDFQARRLNIRYRSSSGDGTRFVHMLNGTAFAIGRTLIAIVENYQTSEGKIRVPKVLQRYVGKELIR